MVALTYIIALIAVRALSSMIHSSAGQGGEQLPYLVSEGTKGALHESKPLAVKLDKDGQHCKVTELIRVFLTSRCIVICDWWWS